MNNWRPQDSMSKEKMKSYDIKRRLKDPVGALIRGAKKRASMKGIEFNMSREDLEPIPKYCPVLELELVFGRQGFKQDDSPSIDRFDNDKGYISGNVRLISTRANELKRDGTIQEFEKVIQYMKDINVTK